MDDKQISQNIVKQIKNYFTERHAESQNSIATRIREYWIGMIRQTLIKQHGLQMCVGTSGQGPYEFCFEFYEFCYFFALNQSHWYGSTIVLNFESKNSDFIVFK